MPYITFFAAELALSETQDHRIFSQWNEKRGLAVRILNPQKISSDICQWMKDDCEDEKKKDLFPAPADQEGCSQQKSDDVVDLVERYKWRAAFDIKLPFEKAFYSVSGHGAEAGEGAVDGKLKVVGKVEEGCLIEGNQEEKKRGNEESWNCTDYDAAEGFVVAENSFSKESFFKIDRVVEEFKYV